MNQISKPEHVAQRFFTQIGPGSARVCVDAITAILHWPERPREVQIYLRGGRRMRVDMDLKDVVRMALGIALGNAVSEILVPDEALMVDPFYKVPWIFPTLLVRPKLLVGIDDAHRVFLEDGTVIHCGKLDGPTDGC